MEEKRSAFPRFYFIGDDDLLEILGQATNPEVIQVCVFFTNTKLPLILFFVRGHVMRMINNEEFILASKSRKIQKPKERSLLQS